MFRYFLLISFAISACRVLHHDPDQAGPIQKGLPGTILLRDSLWLDRYEITNVAWREYTGWTARQYGIGSPEYRATLPDSVFWLTMHDLSTEPMHETYFRSPRYDDYPITGITYDQAVAYCRWRTERVREAICMEPTEKARMPKNFQYRLPTIAEWEYAAAAGLDLRKYPYGYEEIRIKSTRYKIIIQETLPSDTYPETTFGVPGGSGAANRLGFYDLIGNAAEMVAERGIAKGGSYAHTLAESRVTNDIRYDRPMPWLGFRCICEVKK
ncbi:MAG: hypothetical protein DYG98_10850 [Haliscomenobacteraceae bacterium CHB4]|nr:hypothetical protein [Saprospiraceae bacterium]MCE7923548.1 hypothetical protein [Haliscomenobacteraceae bacterium CHB4]